MNSSRSESDCEFYGCYFRVFSEWYAPAHLPLSLAVCAFGLVCNALNVVVLTRRHMRTSTNTLLTGLSVAQLLLVGNYAGLSLLRLGRSRCWALGWSWGGTAFMYANVSLSLFLHSAAFGHTLAIAAFRAAGVHRPLHAQYFLKVRTATRCSALIYVVVGVMCVPTFFSSRVADFSGAAYPPCAFPQFDLEWTRDEALLSLIFWFFGILLKLIPCTVIAALSTCLICSLRKVERRHGRLLDRSAVPFGPELSYGSAAAETLAAHLAGSLSQKPPLRQRRSVKVRTRITRMLVTLVLLCVAVELPHGVVNLLGAVYGSRFSVAVYDNLGDVFELLTLAYSSTNFLLCCAMSRDFRKTFARTYSLRLTLCRRRSVSSGVKNIARNAKGASVNL